MSDFEIIHDDGSDTWHVVGAGIQRFVQMTNWRYSFHLRTQVTHQDKIILARTFLLYIYCSVRYSESLRRFQHALEACGVNKSLIKKGVKEGDTVIVGEVILLWDRFNICLPYYTLKIYV